MDIRLIKFFNKALVEDNNVNILECERFAMERGYIIHPSICNKSVMEFLGIETINCNATFYQSWNDIIEKTEEELLIDQITHYASTYGSNYEGETWIPNDGLGEVPELSSFKVILPMSGEELVNECWNVLTSGIALKNTTMTAIVDAYIYYSNAQMDGVDVDAIKNKEAQIYMCDELCIVPLKPISLLRYIVYQCTGDTLLIKSKESLRAISRGTYDLNTLNENSLKALSSIFYRFKPIFMALKSQSHNNNRSVVNKIRKMAPKYHIPMKETFWQYAMKNIVNPELIQEHVHELNNFQIISICQALIERMDVGSSLYRMYIIRNQKTWLKERTCPSNDEMMNYYNLFVVLHSELVKRLSEKKCVVRYPKNMSVALPSSEKTFIGNLPFGTSYRLDKNNFVGVYWRNEWGTRDFDLSMQFPDGQRIGWNSRKKTDDIVFSGDMTNADPDAAEVMYLKNGCPDALIYVNRFNGTDGSRFKMWFGQSDKSVSEVIEKPYMMDPNDLKVVADCVSENRSQAIGIIHDNVVYLMDFKMGDTRIPMCGEKSFDAFKSKLNAFIPLQPTLEQAGFINYDELSDEEKEETTIDIDFTDINKTTLIDLLK